MILIADNLQITQPAIERAIAELDPKPIQESVLACLEAGAQMIDINTGPLHRESDKKMAFLVNSVQEVCSLPMVLDTVNPLAIEAGLQAARNKAIINGFSLEPDRLKHILPLARKYEADIIGYLLTPEGHVLPNADERLQTAVELLAEIEKAGLEKDRLIIDPLIVPIIWQDGHLQAGQVLRTIQSLPEVLGFEVRTVTGLSNLTAGAKGHPRRLLLERVYLSMLAAAGLDMVLLNVLNPETVAAAIAGDALIGKKPFAWDGW